MRVREISEAEFDGEVAAGSVVVKFFATSCGACRRMTPALERIAGDLAGQARFVKVNVDESPDLVTRYGITSTPTLMVFDAGAPVGRPLVGSHPESVVREAVTGVLASAAGTGWEDPLAWVPTEACTLPTAEQPLRVAEFADLFTGSLRRIDRVSPTRLRLGLDADAEPQARDLAGRETGCCSFFSFSFTAAVDEAAVDGAAVDQVVWMDVEVPTERAEVLDGLAMQAAGALEVVGR